MFEKLNCKILHDSNTLWLTPNNRLSRYLLRDLEAFSYNEQQLSWRTPACLPMRNWLKLLFEQLQQRAWVPATTCLTGPQQVWIWREILAAYFQEQPLIDAEQMIATAMKAWETLQRWQVSVAQVEAYPLSADQLAFTDWCKQVERHYQKHHYIDDSQLATYCTEQLDTLSAAQNASLIAKHIVCYAFDEITPAEQGLLQYCRDQGATVHEFDLQLQRQPSQRYHAVSPEAEMRMAAQWAKEQVTAAPDARIACIDPNLSNNRQQWQRVISDVFNPGTRGLALQHNAASTINISGGEVLAKTPVVKAALNWLQFCFDSIPTTTFSSLWRAPFQQHGQRLASTMALLDQQLRVAGTTQVNCQRILALLKQWQLPEEQHAEIQTLFSTIADTLRTLSPENTFTEWVQIFDARLRQLGWPGDSEFNSEQYQKCQQWQSALVDVSQLDDIQTKKQNAKSALQQMRLACQARLFQPETVDTPVQVLGLLEAAGIAFDAVWITSLDNDNFPQAANPNPLLPYALQAESDMPNATPAREHQFAKRTLARYQASCRGPCVMSLSERVDGHEKLLSPFIANFAVIDDPVSTNEAAPVVRTFEQGETETCHDTHGIPITEPQLLRGGSAVLSHYHACFFKGYAYSQWQAQSVPAFSDGFDALQRGLYCHSAMEWFWQQTKTSAALHDLAPEAQMKRLSIAIDFAIERHLPANLPSAHHHLIHVEKDCLQSILTQWLAEECVRSPFTVEHIEKSEMISLGQCQLKVRIDRIDKLADDTYVIVDYKTGLTSIQDWFDLDEPRMDSPQLPLYAVTSPLDVTGVMFAQLRADNQAYVGVGEDDLALDGVVSLADDDSKPDWHTLKASWSQHLSAMSEVITSGVATLNPKYAEQTCAFCDYAALCRVNECGVR